MWNLEYRRVGNAGGGWPGTFLDIARGADHLTALAVKHKLDLSRVIASGHSAGGHLALWLAGQLETEVEQQLVPQALPILRAYCQAHPDESVVAELLSDAEIFERAMQTHVNRGGADA